MKLQESDPTNYKNKINMNISANNSNIFFVSNINEIVPRDESIDKKSPCKFDKTCHICGSNFFSKFAKDRHIDNIHLKKNLKECSNCNKKFQNIDNHIKTCNKKRDKINSLNNNNNFISFEHFIESNNEKILEEKSKLRDIKINKIKINNITLDKKMQNIDNYEGIKENKNFIAPNYNDNNINKLINLNNYFKEKLLAIENSNSIKINSKNLSENNSITEIIKKNLYDILKKLNI